MSEPQNWQLNTKKGPKWMFVKSSRREENREPGIQVQTGANRFFLKSGRWNQKFMTSKVEPMPSDQVAKPNWGRPPYRGHGGGYQPKIPSWDYHSCEECGGGGYDDCFTCGSSGHVACECTRRRNLDFFFGYPVSEPSSRTGLCRRNPSWWPYAVCFPLDLFGMNFLEQILLKWKQVFNSLLQITTGIILYCYCVNNLEMVL